MFDLTAFWCCRTIWRLCWVFAMMVWRGSCICACSLCWQPVPSVPCCVPSHVPGPSSPSGTIPVVSLRCMAPIDVADVWLVVLRDRDYDDIDEEDPFNPSRRINAYNPSRAQVHSFCSYSSSMGSQTSLHPPLQATSSTPEYM